MKNKNYQKASVVPAAALNFVLTDYILNDMG